MNKKLMYALPVFAAAFALTVVMVTPYALAESGAEKLAKSPSKHHVIQVDGFIGSIPITKDASMTALKDQITVSLSDAAQGIDAKRASIGVVANENNEKFVAWTLISMEKASDTMIITIHIVDAGDVNNTIQITKEFDLSNIKDRAIAKIKSASDRA